MKRFLCLTFSALALVGCSDAYKGQVLSVSQSPDSKLAATVSREGEENSRDAIYHIYLAPTDGGVPDEAVTTANASQVYLRWESDSKILIVFDGGTIHYTHGNSPIAVQNGNEERRVSISITNDLSRRS
jgi:hypothetical protein